MHWYTFFFISICFLCERGNMIWEMKIQSSFAWSNTIYGSNWFECPINFPYIFKGKKPYTFMLHTFLNSIKYQFVSIWFEPTGLIPRLYVIERSKQPLYDWVCLRLQIKRVDYIHEWTYCFMLRRVWRYQRGNQTSLKRVIYNIQQYIQTTCVYINETMVIFYVSCMSIIQWSVSYKTITFFTSSKRKFG